MKTRTPLLITYLAVFGLISGTAFGEEKPGEVQATGDLPADGQAATETQSLNPAANAEAATEAQPEADDKPATDRPAAEDLSTEEGKSLTEEGELLVHRCEQQSWEVSWKEGGLDDSFSTKREGLMAAKEE